MLKIFTIAHKRADLIELQLKSFKKNLQEDFEFIVFNNDNFDTDRLNYNQINQSCKNLNLQVIDVEKNYEMTQKYQPYENCPLFNGDGTYGNANIAVAYALCFSWEKFISKEQGPICLIDSDMFLIQPVKLTDYTQKYQLCFVSQSRHDDINKNICEYIWSPGFILANISNLPEPGTMNFWCGRVHNLPVDTGGQTHFYLEKHPELKIMHIRNQSIPDDPQVNFHPADYESLWLENNQCILHYRSATNWNNKPMDYHIKKTKWLSERLA